MRINVRVLLAATVFLFPHNTSSWRENVTEEEQSTTPAPLSDFDLIKVLGKLPLNPLHPKNEYNAKSINCERGTKPYAYVCSVTTLSGDTMECKMKEEEATNILDGHHLQRVNRLYDWITKCGDAVKSGSSRLAASRLLVFFLGGMLLLGAFSH